MVYKKKSDWLEFLKHCPKRRQRASFNEFHNGKYIALVMMKTNQGEYGIASFDAKTIPALVAKMKSWGIYPIRRWTRNNFNY